MLGREDLTRIQDIGLDGIGLFALLLFGEHDADFMQQTWKKLHIDDVLTHPAMKKLRKAGMVSLEETAQGGSTMLVHYPTHAVATQGTCHSDAVRHNGHRIPLPPPRTSPGYVYIVAGGEYYKIGRAQNPASRLRQLQTHAPFPLSFVSIISTPDMITTEERLHQHFAKKRSHGEWFALHEDDLEWIREQFSFTPHE